MLLDETRTVDTTVTDQDAANARQAAADALAEARRLAESAITNPAVTGARIAEARVDAETAALRAERVAYAAQTAAQARRLIALDAVGEQIDALVADTDDEDNGHSVRAALGGLVGAVRRLRLAVDEHDARIRVVLTEAMALQAEPPGALGGSPTSARVAVSDGVVAMVMHGHTAVYTLAGNVEEAIRLVVAGDLTAARTVMEPIVRRDPVPQGRVRYLVNRQGAVFNFVGSELATEIAKQVIRGELVEMDADMGERWRTGFVTPGQVTTWARPRLAQAAAGYRRELARPRDRRIHTERGPVGFDVQIGA